MTQSKADRTLEFYRHVLASVNVYDAGDGCLSLYTPTEDGDWSPKPCTINNKRLVLPTKDHLRDGQWEDKVAFHPLSENLLRGESDVLKLLKRLVQFRTQTVIASLLQELADIAGKQSRHQELTPSQAKFLAYVPEANEKTIKMVAKIIDRHFEKLFSIYLKRKGVVNDQEVRRLAVATFPVYDDLQTKGSKVDDLDVGSAKVKRTIAALFEFVLPDIDEPMSYVAGSNSQVAPYFDALMTLHYRISKQLNGLVHRYRKHIDFHQALKTDLQFADELEEIGDLKDAIPPLVGNKGANAKGEKEEVEETSTSKPSTVNQNFQRGAERVNSPMSTGSEEEETITPTQPQPSTQSSHPPQVQTNAPAPPSGSSSSGGKLDWRSVMASRNVHAPPMGSGYGQPPMSGGMVQPQSSPFQLNPMMMSNQSQQQSSMSWQQPQQQPWAPMPGPGGVGPWGGGGGFSSSL